MSVRAVIFDLFGALVPNILAAEYQRMADAMAAAVGAQPAEFAHTYSAGTWQERATGVLASTEAAVAYTCAALGIQADADAIAAAARIRIELTRRTLRPLPGAVETIATLRARGYRVGLISDCSAEVPLLWPECALAPLIEATVFSCAVGMKKPDPRINALACARLRVEPAECLYVGDGSEQELSGAAAACMCPVLVRVAFEETTNPYRPEAVTWDGLAIDTLADVLALVGITRAPE
jgi:putative hydrolase of the HAD superfamily